MALPQLINIGSTANDGTGDTLRTGFNKTNIYLSNLNSRMDALETDPISASSLFRRKTAITANGSAGQSITYTTPLTSAGRPILDDYQGLGLTVTAYTDNGFTLTSLASGLFGYVTFIEI